MVEIKAVEIKNIKIIVRESAWRNAKDQRFRVEQNEVVNLRFYNSCCLA